jgi:hypothetical protein
MKASVFPYLLGALAILGVSLLVQWMGSLGILDGDVGTRIFMVSIGILVAASGNQAPKLLDAPRASPTAERLVQRATRRPGWVMTLAGIFYAIVWIVAPEDFAQLSSVGVLGCAVIYTVAQMLHCRRISDTAATR